MSESTPTTDAREAEQAADSASLTTPAPPQIDRVILLLLTALLLFSGPLLWWWTAPGHPWYQPYLIWAGLIALIALMMIREPRDS